jgi:hypothetical protein
MLGVVDDTGPTIVEGPAGPIEVHERGDGSPVVMLP